VKDHLIVAFKHELWLVGKDFCQLTRHATHM
jgi:hypothetical protein